MKTNRMTGLLVWMVLNAVAGPVSAGDFPRGSAPGPILAIEGAYPGANAAVVADSVVAPIEAQLNGVENAIHFLSRARNDGRFRVAVTFKPGTDVNTSKVLVQNRVALAIPTLPDEVKRNGVTVRQKVPIRLLVGLSSPKDRYDGLYLSNYATIQIKDELLRTAGVGEIVGIGLNDAPAFRIILDPLKMEARKLSAHDVVAALEKQNLHAPAGQIGRPPVPAGQDFQFDLKTLGRLSDPKEIGEIVISTKDNGIKTLLKDIARVELWANSAGNHAAWNGKPTVFLGIASSALAPPKTWMRTVATKLDMLRARLPDGLRLDSAFDFSDPAASPHVLIDLHLPELSSAERRREVLANAEKVVRGIPGVKDVLAATENPFDGIHDHPCILARLANDQRKSEYPKILQAIRKSLAQIPNVDVRLRTVSCQGGVLSHRYPVDFAVSGPELESVVKLGKQLGDRLAAGKKLTDLWVSREMEPIAQLVVDVDRTKALREGIPLQDVFGAVQGLLGPSYINDFNRFGRSVQVVVETPRKSVEEIKRATIRNKEGKMIPLAELVTLRPVEAPSTILRLNQLPMVEITANPADEVELPVARKLCEKLFQDARKDLRLSGDYRLTWLNETSK